MSKRLFPREYGERKKPRLDASISNHKIPLSLNNVVNKAIEEDTWGTDEDDEILILASQACEDAQNNSLLPDYSSCMQQLTTSTQYDQPGPSKSVEFTFKKPTLNTSSVISTNLKEKVNRISSPLPGISSKILQNNHHIDLTDDFIFNDKTINQATDSLYNQLLQLKKENAKLKSEHGKLLDKCVTKEGEASILRTQLRSSQVALDNARMDKIKALEKITVEYTEKIDRVNRVMSDLKTQLEFKNSEIINIKEKCKILESSKVKLTQVTLGANEITASHRFSNGTIVHNSNTLNNKRVKTVSNSVQTDDKLHFLKLYTSSEAENTNLEAILPHILQATPNQHYSILDYNEKLQRHTDLTQHRCRVYSTFHRIPSTPMQREDRQSIMDISCIYEEVCSIAMGCEDVKEKCFKVFDVICSVLLEVQSRLEKISQRISPVFQKEMDEKYMEATSTFQDVTREDLLRGRILYKEEQEMLARRLVGVMAFILEHSKTKNILQKYEELCVKRNKGKLVDLLSRICQLIDSTSCATIYSGLLLSISISIETQITSTTEAVFVDILKSSITSRPASFVCCHLLGVVAELSKYDGFKESFCVGSGGNLKTDYDQGVLLYKRDSCYIQILILQIEVCLKCIENQNIRHRAIEITRNLIRLHDHISLNGNSSSQSKKSCDCQLLLIQITVYALKICAIMLRDDCKPIDQTRCDSKEVLQVCRSGIQVLYRCVLRDAEFSSRLAHNEGDFIEFCEIMKDMDHKEIYGIMLTELKGAFQTSPELATQLVNKQVWIDSFNSFSISD